ncbi:hypothetical protein OHA79_04585 [Streptomyces sp. NBC_00841]|uniref:hypothetical protein n=1 Tax=Streptomyces sp. NBC_01669 TaxID=2975909 RepID=UPI00225533F6|nr:MULTISPECIES: hypothetical protein [unclassified Streptomyces]MCX4537551.1 hypothetical protein [Streptomyces sp. NBC_01669]WRZ97236.1 hypothetical protein OHA79_04585 [Streptomyces sp. NBC_00841]
MGGSAATQLGSDGADRGLLPQAVGYVDAVGFAQVRVPVRRSAVAPALSSPGLFLLSSGSVVNVRRPEPEH